MGKNNDIDEIEVGEDYTKYGEFISSYFAWISLPKQKERVKELENISNNKKKRKWEKMRQKQRKTRKNTKK